MRGFGQRARRNFGLFVCYVLAAALSLFVCLPFVYMVLTSFQNSNDNIFSIPPRLFPEVWTIRNYADAFQGMHFMRALANTVVMVVSTMALGIGASILVAYGFARCEARGKNLCFFVLLATMMLPWVVTMIPAFVVFKVLGWLGTRLPLIVPAIGGGAFNVFLLRQFIMGIPRDLDEAAKIDGCSSFRVLCNILLPNMKPVLATLFVFSFTGTWSDYLGPSIYFLDQSLHTLSLSLYNFRSVTGYVDWKLTMAGCVMFAVPMIAVLFAAQKSFTRGIVVSSFK